MATSKFQVHIEPLTNTNYDTWKVQAEAVLTKAGLIECISGIGDTKKDSLAKAELILIISPNELKIVRSCKTSKDVWDTLKTAYESRGPARKATLLKKLLHLKLKPGENVRDHINQFVDLVDKLKDMEIDVNADLLTIMMLYSLPESFENFRVAIETRDKLPSLDELKTKIIEESEARERDADTPEEAFYTHKFKQYNKQKPGQYNQFKFGKRQGGKKFETKRYDQNFCAIEACFKIDINSPNRWCLDSGCTSHMINDRSLFENFIEMEDTVYLASTDKIECIKGKGLVTLKVGNANIKLNDALYIPKLSANLVSVSRAAKKKCYSTFREYDAFIENKEGEIILTCICENGLYYIQNIQNPHGATQEAEYMSLTDCAKESIHLQNLLNSIGQKQNKVTIYNDNQAAQKSATNPIISSKSKHIDIKQHYIREVIEKGLIEVAYIKTEDMPADVLTKALPKVKFVKCRESLGLA